MNPKLPTVLIVLCLTACATRMPSDDAPASDLDVLAANVERDARPTLLSNGKEYCAEFAVTERQQDECMGDLEDGLFNSNRRGERQAETIHKYIHRERLRRNPCGFFKRTFRPRECK